jgi:hypothetical protein
LVTDENDYVLADSFNILKRRKNYICHLLNIREANANDVRQTEMYIAEPLVLEPSFSEVEIAVEKT